MPRFRTVGGRLRARHIGGLITGFEFLADLPVVCICPAHLPDSLLATLDELDTTQRLMLDS